MKDKMVPRVLMLAAGAITGVICIYHGFQTLYSLKLLLAVLLIFYFLGLIAEKLYRKVMTPSVEEEVSESSEEESASDEEETSE